MSLWRLPVERGTSAVPLSSTLATDAQRPPDGSPADPSCSELLHELSDLPLQCVALVVQIGEVGQAAPASCPLKVVPWNR